MLLPPPFRENKASAGQRSKGAFPWNLKERRRMRAWELLERDWRVTDVAEALGVNRSTVSGGKDKPGGKQALMGKPQHVPQCRLQAEQKDQLRTILLAGAQAAGFPTDLWTTRRVALVMIERFGIQYNPDHLGRILHALGFSCPKSSRRASEQDP